MSHQQVIGGHVVLHGQALPALGAAGVESEVPLGGLQPALQRRLGPGAQQAALAGVLQRGAVRRG